MEDQQIVALFQGRSEYAIPALQEKFGALCRSVITHILPDQRDVEECVSDAYLRIWNSIPPDYPGNLAGYLSRIARNIALDRYDYNSAGMRSSALTCAYEELEACLPASDDPGRHIERLEFTEFLNRFLRAQTKEARIFFIRRYWYGESIREISAACRCSEEKVKTSLFRTRNKLRAAMEKEGYHL